MSNLEQLNENQKAAVLNVDSHLRIIAGAGSGKTRVITARIVHLVQDLGVYPPSILAITFTNKAANEMKERIVNQLHDEAAGIVLSTIHSLCVRILREDIYVLGYPRNFTIIDTDDQKTILKEAYALYGLDVKRYSYNNMLSYISHNKTGKVSPEQAKDLGKHSVDQERLAKVYAYYEKRLADMFALDFDDLLIKTQELFATHTIKRRKWQSRYDYVHVDEFQDVDEIQYDIIRYLVSDKAYLCVVGDPDQTIYTWRGAKVDIILHFEKDFKGAKTIFLNENYRSTPAILQAANSLIANNQNRLEKELFTQRSAGDKVVHYSAFEEAYEPKWVVEQISNLHKQGIAFQDVAVLYRSNYLSRGLEKLLLEQGIPYVIYGGIRFYDRAEIKDVLCYLRMLVSGDDLAFKRIINTPKRKIGPKTIEGIFDYAQEHRLTMYEAIKQARLGKGKTQEQLDRFVYLIEKFRNQIGEKEISKILEEIIQSSGYLTMLEEDKEVERIENIKELINDIMSFEKNNPQPSLEDYLQMVALYSDLESNTQTRKECVQLMSVHAAKGLEFDHVFVYGMSEGVFPSERAMMEGGFQGLEEERRLAYVAFTRARKRLYLSDAKGYSYVLDKFKTTSRFIQEIDENTIEHLGAGQPLPTPAPTPSLAQSKGPAKVGERLRTGDKVIHATFGEGIVVKVENNIAQIAFDHKHGVRKIVCGHPSIQKK
ncbi:MAG: ATP-dependent helicase [Erysipelotrichaceae bacterium]